MSRQSLLFATFFVFAHILFVAPFVPVLNILPAGLGALSMSSMALTLILAARWRVVDRLMGGPDKSYAAHRWLGFFAFGGAMGHWALATSVGKGVLPILAESGEGVGTVAAIGLVVLTAAALVRFIPYHVWKASHMLMGPIFLMAAYHTFMVASPLAVGAAPWAFMAVVSIIGLLAWGQTLLRKRTPTRLVKVEKAVPFTGGMDILLRSDTALPDFRPGQFATIAHNRARAEAHPFTIAGGDEHTRRFVIRAAGDWTEDFVRQVAAGDELRLSAGVGRFLPQVRKRRTEQLWLAGGVGITPFLATLEKMEADDGARVTLVFCIRSRDSVGALEDVERHAERLPQLRLTILNNDQGDRLSIERLTELVQNMSGNTQVYLCGPEGLKALVSDVWATTGMKGRIHTEQFDFRGAYSIDELIYMGKPVFDKAQDLLSEQIAH